MGSGTFKRLGAVVFTVGSGEYRNEYGRLCDLVLTYINTVCLVNIACHCLGTLHCLGGEYLLQLGSPGNKCLFHGDLHITIYEYRLLGHGTDHGVIQFLLFQCSHLVCGDLCQNIAQSVVKQVVCGYLIVDLHTQLVTEGHLCYSCCHTLGIQSISGYDRTIFGQFVDLAI